MPTAARSQIPQLSKHECTCGQNAYVVSMARARSKSVDRAGTKFLHASQKQILDFALTKRRAQVTLLSLVVVLARAASGCGVRR